MLPLVTVLRIGYDSYDYGICLNERTYDAVSNRMNS